MKAVVEQIFDNHDLYMKKVNKKTYEKNMESFISEQSQVLGGLLSQVREADDSEQAAIGIGREFADEIYALFSKRGRMNGTRRASISLYMIYFLFPAILETGDTKATLLCDKIRDGWNAKSGEKINYTDYATIHGSFKEKMFGIF